MRRRVVPVLLGLVLLVSGVATPTPALAGYGHPYHHHHGVSVSVGFGFGWPYGYGYGYGWPYYGWPYGYGYGWPYYGWPYGGYVAAPRTVYVHEGDKKDLPATVETKIKPRKAQVVLDGEAVGKAGDYDGDWNVLFLEPGRHVIEFSAPELMTFRTVIDAKAGSNYRIQEQMRKGEGLDPRSSSEPAPEPRPTRPSAPAERSEGLRSGFLWLRVSPADATVYLDGKFLGSAEELSRLHGALPVALGRHKVEVLMPGYPTITRSVDVENDEPVELTIDLER